jgi:hypothetical protein
MTALYGYLIGAGAVLAAFVVTYLRGLSSGKKLERQKQAQAEAKARDIADDVDNDLSTLTPEQARERLRQWSKQ